MAGYVFRNTPVGVTNSGADTSEDDAIHRAMLDAAGPDPGDEVAPEAEPGMSDEEFQAVVRFAASDAEEFIDGHIGPLRAEATKYFRGDPFGDEEEGRSSFVMTDVRDSVLGVVPSLLRLFVGGEHAVEFVPQSPEAVEEAAQQTDYVSYVFMQDNPGFLILDSFAKDALTRKTGIVKWRWSEDTTISEQRYTGLSADQVAIFETDRDVEIVELTERIETPQEPNPVVQAVIQSGMPNGGQPGSPLVSQPAPLPPTYDVRIRRRRQAKRCIVECIPPEEWLINRDARDPNSERGYRFQAHRAIRTVSEIVAMGYDRETVEEHATGEQTLGANVEAIARNPVGLGLLPNDSPDPSQRMCVFYEAYIYADRDGDGIAELHKVHAIGDAYHILHDEIVDEAPFAVFCPVPEPHTAIGGSVADQVMDIQRIKSNIMRHTMDSLAESIHPRTAVLEQFVNMDDVLNTDQNAVIRIKGSNPQAVQELNKTFVGQQALQVLGYLDDIKSKRTGLSDASQGLSPEMLQSATESAVSATITGAQERIEMYARILAETAMRRLFKGIAKTLRENQDQARMVKLRGKYVAVDPRTWIGELECVPTVALGRGTDQQKMGFLSEVAKQQWAIMQELGPVNPVCGVDRYIATLSQVVNLAGFKDASKYFGAVTDQFMQQLQQSAANKPPSPELMVAQAEIQKVQGDHQLALMKFQQAQLEADRKAELDREKVHLDAIARLYATQAQYGSQPDQGLLDSILQHQQALAQIQSDHVTALHQNTMQARGQMGTQAVKALMQPQAQPQQAPSPQGLAA